MNEKKTLILSVTSVKGGTGKTTNVLNLAGTYCNLKKKVLIIDLDLYSGDIAAILDLNNEKDIYNLFEDLNNKNFNNIEDYITNYNEYIDVLCAPNDPRFAGRINGTVVNFILTKMSKKYDVILIDTNHFLNSLNLTAFDKSTEILYVLNNDLMNIKNMKTMVSIFNNMGKKNYKVLLYEARNKNKGPYKTQEIKTLLKHEIDFYISNGFYVKNINAYILKGKILTLSNNYSISKIYNEISMSFMKKVKYEK